MSGGGGGSNDVPPPPLGTQYAFQNQPGADQGAFGGTNQITGNSFYPNPNMSSFLFPKGVTNSAGIQTIAPQGQPPPPPPPAPPAPPQQNYSFLSPTAAQTILQGGYATLDPTIQAMVQQQAGGYGQAGASGPTQDQSLARAIMNAQGGGGFDPATQAQLSAIAYGGGGGGGATSSGGAGGMAQSLGGGGGGYVGGAPNYAPYGPQGVGGPAPGGGGGGGINSTALQQGGIGGGGTMNLSYPGAAAFIGLGPGIAQGAGDVNNIDQNVIKYLQGSQAQAPGVGQALEAQSTSMDPNMQSTGQNFLAQSTNPMWQNAEGMTLNTAFDPQQSLYDRTLQQTQEQTRAGLEARGMDMTPYGAGVEGDQLRNFNIDWQNTQLQRQGQGAQNAAALAQTASGLGSTGAGILGQGVQNQAQLAKAGEGVLAQNTLAAGMVPDIAQAGLSAQQGALSSLQGGAISAYAQPQQGIQDYLSYLQAATGQNSVNANIYGSQLNAANQAQANSNSMGLGLLSGIGGLVGK